MSKSSEALQANASAIGALTLRCVKYGTIFHPECYAAMAAVYDSLKAYGDARVAEAPLDPRLALAICQGHIDAKGSEEYLHAWQACIDDGSVWHNKHREGYSLGHTAQRLINSGECTDTPRPKAPS